MRREDSTFKSADNLSLAVTGWLPVETPQRIVLVVHGHGEHKLRYTDVAAFYNKAGYGLFAMDLRGHGDSEGKRGHAPSMDQLLLDLEYFIRHVREEYLNADFFLYGHSMGGNIVLNYLLQDKSKEIKAAIVSSPWIRLKFKPPKWKLVLGKIATKILPSFCESSELLPEEISSVPKEVEAYANDPDIHDQISARLFAEITAGGERILLKGNEIKHPIFLAHGALDEVTSFKASEELSQLNNKIGFTAYPNSKHEIHHDKDKEELLENELDWLEKLD